MAGKAAVSRRQRDLARQRGEILETALRLFVEKGYHEVSMREIAEAAEFATGTLYKFFDSKESLYRELVRTHARRMTEPIASSLDGGGDEREKIVRYIRAHVHTLSENAPAVRLYFRQLQGFAVDLSDPDGEVSRLRESVLRKLARVIAAGVRKGIFRPVDPQRTAAALSGMLQALTIADPSRLTHGDPEEIASLAEELLFRGMGTAS